MDGASRELRSYHSKVDDVRQTLELIFIKFTGVSIEPMILDDLLVRWRPTCYPHPAGIAIERLYNITCIRTMKHVYQPNAEMNVEVICGGNGGKTKTAIWFHNWHSHRCGLVSMNRARFGAFIVDRLLDREMYIHNFHFNFASNAGARGDCCTTGRNDLDVCTICKVAVCHKCKKNRRIHDHCNCTDCKCRRCRSVSWWQP